MQGNLKFTKMHGIGNDYVFIDTFQQTLDINPCALSKRLSNRNTGIGSDGLVIIMPCKQAQFRMRMFNADGSEGEVCGNAIRCVGKYVYESKLTNETNLSIQTLAGIKSLQLFIFEDKVTKVKVDMGEPILKCISIPILLDTDTCINQEIKIGDTIHVITSLSMGNPHAVIFVKDVHKFPVATVGPQVENHQIFPNRTNTEFVQIVDRTKILQRTWERGSGETLACGSGACASVVACVLNGLTDRKVIVSLNGGDLEIEWEIETNHVFMSGPAETVFRGEVDL